jgi:hypothetical protein
MDEKRAECEREEEEEERLGFFGTPANPVPAKYVLLTYRASPVLRAKVEPFLPYPSLPVRRQLCV